MDHFNDKVVSKAEAASLALAIKNNGLVGCNDSIFKEIIEKYDLDVISSADIILMSFKKKLITKEEASNIWKKMARDRVPLPYKTFLEFLDNK